MNKIEIAHQAAIECEAASERHKIASEEYDAITEQVMDELDAIEARYEAAIRSNKC